MLPTSLTRLMLAALLALSPLLSHANLAIGSNVSCSGALTIMAGDNIPSSVDCVGDLTFSGASLTSDTILSIFATNNLSFLDVLVSGPQLIFTAGSNFLLDATSSLTARQIVINADTITLHGTVIPVPEPSAPMMLLAGLGLLVALCFRSHSAPRGLAG